MTTQDLLHRMLLCSYWKYIEEKTPESRAEWEYVSAEYRKFKEREIKERELKESMMCPNNSIRELESTLPPTPLEVAQEAEHRAFLEHSRNPNTETWQAWYRSLVELNKQKTR